MLLVRSRIYILILLLAAATATRGYSQTFALHDGDRVVFYGDSITAQRLYTRFVEDMVLTRYPQMHVDFWNAGVPGDTVNGGYAGNTEARLKRDVFPHKPTVVTVMLGMNDGGYGTFNPKWFDAFTSGYRNLLTEVDTELPGVRITVITPSPYDEITHGTEFPGYNGVLERYADQISQFGKEPHRMLADFYGPLMNLLITGKRENPALAQLIIPDRIHPSESGHWIMAEALMRAWGMTPIVSSVQLDADSEKVLDAQNAAVTGIQRTLTGLRWTQLDRSLPLPLNLSDPMMQFLLKISDLGSVDQQMLRLQGLKAPRYTLKIDGARVASFTREELAAGVNLAFYPTPMENQAKDVDWIEVRRTKLDEARFMLIGEGLNVEGSGEAAKTLELAQAAMAREQREKAQPKAHAFELAAE